MSLFVHINWAASRCPLWVISRHVRRKKRCPPYPE